MSPDGDGAFKVNLHAPTMNKSNPGALGIPEFRSPDGDELLKKNAVCCLLRLHTALLYVSHFSS
jgi:hypothetical protein